MNKEELFNLRHASFRNQMERAFGVMKKRFAVLKNTLVMGNMSFQTGQLSPRSLVDASQLGPLHSSTVQLITVFLLFSLAAQFGWRISNIDVTAAYLNKRLPVEQRIPMVMGKEETALLVYHIDDKLLFHYALFGAEGPGSDSQVLRFACTMDLTWVPGGFLLADAGYGLSHRLLSPYLDPIHYHDDRGDSCPVWKLILPIIKVFLRSANLFFITPKALSTWFSPYCKNVDL